jgi:hypothetical protein
MLLTGLLPDIVDLPVQRLEDISLDSLSQELDFLREFRAGVYEQCRAYKEQKPDHFWVNLVEVFGNRNLPEQVILRTHYKAIRRAWRKRYKLLKEQRDAQNPAPVKNRDQGISS